MNRMAGYNEVGKNKKRLSQQPFIYINKIKSITGWLDPVHFSLANWRTLRALRRTVQAKPAFLRPGGNLKLRELDFHCRMN